MHARIGAKTWLPKTNQTADGCSSSGFSSWSKFKFILIYIWMQNSTILVTCIKLCISQRWTDLKWNEKSENWTYFHYIEEYISNTLIWDNGERYACSKRMLWNHEYMDNKNQHIILIRISIPLPWLHLLRFS